MSDSEDEDFEAIGGWTEEHLMEVGLQVVKIKEYMMEHGLSPNVVINDVAFDVPALVDSVIAEIGDMDKPKIFVPKNMH